MKNYRLTFSNLGAQGLYDEIIFTTIIQAKSMRGAKQRARNLEPFKWGSRSIKSLECERNLALDKIEFNY